MTNPSETKLVERLELLASGFEYEVWHATVDEIRSIAAALASLADELRQARERCAELEGIYYAHKEYGDVYGAMSKKLEEYEALLKRWLIRFGSAGGHSTLYDETKAALVVPDAAASGPKEGGP